MNNNYDVVVIGHNVNGLATAALLARRGFSACLIPHSGEVSMANETVSPPLFYSWDCSRGAFGHVLDTLRIRSRLVADPPRRIDKIITPSFTMERPFGWDAFQKMMMETFPKERESLAFYFQEMNQLGEEWRRILQAETIYSVSSVQNTMKYRSKSYSDFIDALFQSDGLKSILLANQPRKGVALPVMAGFLVTQIFDYHCLPGGYHKVCEVLREEFGRLGGISHENSEAIRIRKKALDHFEVDCQGQETLVAKCLVSTFDKTMTLKTYLSEFDPGELEDLESLNPIAPFSVSLKLKEGFHFEEVTPGYALYYFLSEQPASASARVEQPGVFRPPIRVYPCPEQKQMVLQIDIETGFIPGSDESYNHLADQILESLERIIPVSQWIERRTLFTPGQIEKELGYQKGFWNRWAFRANEMAANPFEQKPLRQGIFTTGQWGGAWFTAALAASRAVAKHLKTMER